MSDETPGRKGRRVRIYSLDGVVEGSLQVGARLRTLDDLNVVSKRFVVLRSPSDPNGSWRIGTGPLAINKKAILFVQELDVPPAHSGTRFSGFTRAGVRLKIKDYEVEGFVHVPPGGEAMRRLDQDNHAFVSLTTVLVTAADGHEAAPFLAVNRDFITAAQVVELDEEPESPPPSHVDAHV